MLKKSKHQLLTSTLRHFPPKLSSQRCHIFNAQSFKEGFARNWCGLSLIWVLLVLDLSHAGAWGRFPGKISVLSNFGMVSPPLLFLLLTSSSIKLSVSGHVAVLFLYLAVVLTMKPFLIASTLATVLCVWRIW